MASTTHTYTILTGTVSTAGSIRNWVQHSSIPAAQILAEAEAYIYAQIRVREMMTSAAITIASGAYTTALPTGFLDPVSLRLDEDSTDLDYVQENLLGRIIDENGSVEEGRPARWALYDDLIQYDVANDEASALNGDMVYYKLPDSLAASTNETNFLTDKYPWLLRRACTMFGYEHRKRSAEFLAEQKLVDEAIMQVNQSADMSRRGQILR